jgi:hypothetical protein
MKIDMDMDEDGCSVFQKDRMRLTFLIWDFEYVREKCHWQCEIAEKIRTKGE